MTSTTTVTATSVEILAVQPVISNGGFERGLDRWLMAQDPNTVYELTGNAAHNGEIGVRTVCGVPAGPGPYSSTVISQKLNTKAGVTYDFAVWYRWSRSSPNVYFNGFVDGEYILSVRSTSPDSVNKRIGDWVDLRGSFTAKRDGAELNIWLTCTNYESNELSYDEVVITARA